MEAIISFDIKKGISKNGVLPWNVQENLQHFYNKTKCNAVIMGRTRYISIPESKRPLKNRLNVVLTREPNKYKEIVDRFKNVFFTNHENVHEIILLFPNKYSDTYPILNKFFKMFFIGGNEIIYNKYMPLCKSIWVTKMKEDYGCELFFDYNLEDKFCEEKVFESEVCNIYKYSIV
jgi:dihydrofolate reductase